MALNITFRQMKASDAPAIAKLFKNSPDAGQVSFTPYYNIDIFEAFLLGHPEMVGVVAESTDVEGVIGSNIMNFGHCYFEGELRPYAMGNLAKVHPNYRRQGIATQMKQWLIDYTYQKTGNETVIWSLIQKGNISSQKTVQKWYKQFGGQIIVYPAKMLNKPPSPIQNLSVRVAKPSELAEISQQLNQFYTGYNFYEPQNAEHLTHWLAQTPFEEPFRHYMVVTDKSNQILAGMALIEEYRVRGLHITDMPFVMEMLNKLVKLLPSDGIMREVLADKIWYAPGHLTAAQYLWDTLRWQWRDKGNVMRVMVDANSPIVDIFRLRPWTLKSEMAMAAAGPVAMSLDRLVSPIL